MKDNNWSNKWVFILAAIGSAAGLGNLWKFPYMVYDNGGGAFIIAYLFMLFLIGIGLIIGEIALGQKTREGAPKAIGNISPYFKWIGWATIGGSFIILTYYVVVIGWSMDYLYYSIKSLFTGNLDWAKDSSGFFFNEVLQLTDGVDNKGKLSMKVFIGTLASIVLIYFFTFKGAKSVGKTVIVTATLPFLTLIILAIKGVSLEGSHIGLSYLWSIEASKLFQLSTWTAAAGQIFFTLSLAMGVMIAYGAMKKENSEIVKSTIIVTIGNTIISFLSAIAVFGTLGYLANQKGLPVNEVVAGGPSLVFVVLPETLSLFSSLSSIFAVIFFVTVFLLAIDSAMSLVEGVVYPLKNIFKKIKQEFLVLFVIIGLTIVSTIYMYGNGLYILDIVDYYITQFAMIIIGLVEALLFIFYFKKLGKYIDKNNTCLFKLIINKWYFLVSWIIASVFLLGLLFLNIQKGILVYGDYSSSYLKYGLFIIIIVFIFSIIINLLDRK